MSDYDFLEDDEEDTGFTSSLDDADLTDFSPKFRRIEAMQAHYSELQELKVDELVRRYIEARNQLATDRKGYKAREAEVKGYMSIISMTLRDRGDQLGVDNFATAEGTAYRNKKETFRVSDWNALSEYVKESGNFQVLQKRVSPNAVKDIRETEGFLIPGVDPFVEIEFAVRKPSARKRK